MRLSRPLRGLAMTGTSQGSHSATSLIFPCFSTQGLIPGAQHVVLVETDGMIEALRTLFLGIDESQLAAQVLQTAQTFQQAGAPQPQVLVFGRGSHRLVVGGAGDIVVPDGAEGRR